MCCQSPGNGWTSQLVVPSLDDCVPQPSVFNGVMSWSCRAYNKMALVPVCPISQSPLPLIAALGVPLPSPTPHTIPPPAFCTSLRSVTRLYCRGFQVCLFVPLVVQLSEENGQIGSLKQNRLPQKLESFSLVLSTPTHWLTDS